VAFADLSISGVIEPGAKAAAAAAGAKKFPVIGVLATEATVRSKAYEHAIHRRRSHARLLLRPAPLLVPIIEEGRKSDDPITTLALQQYLRPLIKRGVEVLVLGCTHYPILRPLIEELVGPKVRVIDSAEQCAHDVARRLRMKGLQRPMSDDAPEGGLRCFVTDDSPRFGQLASRFLGMAVDPPRLVSIDELYEMDRTTGIRQAV
jgi:glutamate racemase